MQLPKLVLGLIRGTFPTALNNLNLSLNTSLIRPHLGYATSAWDPYIEKHLSQLEHVLRYAARLVKHSYSKTEGTVTKVMT